MRDLLVITPSRGRPGRLREMLAAALSLSEAETEIAVALDNDDLESYDLYECVQLPGDTRPADGAPRVIWHHGPRDTLTGWTNKLAVQYAGQYRALASLGDDHIPRTPGWDTLLLAAIDAMGGTGIAYGDDGIFGQGLPTAPVISADIVKALGWMCLPACRHMAVDLAWKDIGLGAGCLAWVPEVTVEHVHPAAGKAQWDATYAASEAGKEEDRAAYFAWKDSGGLADAVETVLALRGKTAA